MPRRVRAFVDPTNTVIKAFIDEKNLELKQGRDIVKGVLSKWLDEFASKSASPLISKYKVDVEDFYETVSVRNANFRFNFWRVRFLPPGGEGSWNVINTLSTGRRGMPRREAPYVLPDAGIVQRTFIGSTGSLWRDIKRSPTVTSPNSAKLVNSGETTTLFSQGPISPVPARNFYPELLEMCRKALRSKNVDVNIEIIEV